MSKRKRCWVVWTEGCPVGVFLTKRVADDHKMVLDATRAPRVRRVVKMVEHDPKLERLLKQMEKRWSDPEFTYDDKHYAANELGQYLKSHRSRK